MFIQFKATLNVVSLSGPQQLNIDHFHKYYQEEHIRKSPLGMNKTLAKQSANPCRNDGFECICRTRLWNHISS